jgi:hypothetical protein
MREGNENEERELHMPRALRTDKVAIAPPRLGLAVVLALSAVLPAGCSTHQAAAVRTCPVAKHRQAVVVSSKGGTGLAKIGLTPKVLKTQQGCSF